MVADNTVAAIAVVEVAFVVDTGVEVVRIVAIVELTPKMYVVVAIVAVEGLGLVVVALNVPPLDHLQSGANTVDASRHGTISMAPTASHRCPYRRSFLRHRQCQSSRGQSFGSIRLARNNYRRL